MKWRKMDAYFVESDRGYRVTKSYPGPIYTVWAPERWMAWNHKPVFYSEDWAKAKRFAEHHNANK